MSWEPSSLSLSRMKQPRQRPSQRLLWRMGLRTRCRLVENMGLTMLAIRTWKATSLKTRNPRRQSLGVVKSQFRWATMLRKESRTLGNTKQNMSQKPSRNLKLRRKLGFSEKNLPRPWDSEHKAKDPSPKTMSLKSRDNYFPLSLLRFWALWISFLNLCIALFCGLSDSYSLSQTFLHCSQ